MGMRSHIPVVVMAADTQVDMVPGPQHFAAHTDAGRDGHEAEQKAGGKAEMAKEMHGCAWEP